MKHYFNHWIGQKAVTNYLDRVINAKAMNPNYPLQPLFFTGMAGQGKTMLMRLVAEAMESELGYRNVVISAKCTRPELIQAWGELIQGKECVVRVDECSDVVRNKGVANLWKELLENEKGIKEVPVGNGLTLETNPFQQWPLFASNEEPKDAALFGPNSRTKQLMLQPYAKSEVIEMLEYMASKHNFKFKDNETLEFAAGRIIPNGRSISEFCENEIFTEAIISQDNVITLETMQRLVKESCRFPLGFRSIDIITLQALQARERGLQVNEIAAACKGEPNATTQERLRQLAGVGFVITNNGKKCITPEGCKYLETIANLQKEAREAKRAAKQREKDKATAKDVSPLVELPDKGVEREEKEVKGKVIIGTPKKSMIKREAKEAVPA